MGPLDAAWPLLTLVVPAGGTALLAAAVAKLAWRGELGAVPWRSLALAAAGAGAAVVGAGVVVVGRDGSIATYGAMGIAIAVMLWWRGFQRRR